MSDDQINIEEVIARLSRLSQVEYDQVRISEAESLGIRISTLDNEVEKARQTSETNESRNMFKEIRPYSHPVDGEALIRELADTFNRYSILPKGSADAFSLWTVLTYCYDSFRILPMLAIVSPEKRCGKTTTVATLTKLCNRPIAASSISAASMFRSIDAWKPSLLVDEADTFLKSNEELRGIINSGHTKDAAYVIRCVGTNHDPMQFSTWCPKVIAMIGMPPGTILDRSVVVPLSRKLPSETVEQLDDAAEEIFEILKAKIIRFVRDNTHNLKMAKPTRLQVGNDRYADNWKPLLAIAAVAGKEILEKTELAAQMLMLNMEDEETASVQLLADIRQIFETYSITRITSKELVQYLIGLEERPWCEWKHGNPMTQISLARLLKPFAIKSKSIRTQTKTAKGFNVTDFHQAFSRYLPEQSVTTAQDNDISDLSPFTSGTVASDVPFQKQGKHPESLGCSVVPLSQEGYGNQRPKVISEDDLFDDVETAF